MSVKQLTVTVAILGGIFLWPAAVWPQEKPALEVAFNEAVAAMQAGRLSDAESGFTRVLAADPENLPALGNLGVLYAKTHRLAKAIEVDQRALSISPKDPSLLLNIGLAYMKQEDYTRARPYFESLDTGPSSGSRSALLLATCLVLGDSPKEGVALINSRRLESQDASALYLEAVGYARLNQTDASGAIFQRLLENGGTRAQANFLLGQAFHDGHRLQEAAASFTTVLTQEPGYPGAHRELGKVYISMQRFSDAEKELHTAIAEDPADGSALYFLGALLVQTAREREGTPLLERAETLVPDSWAIPFYRGKAAVKQGQPAIAIPLLQRAAAMNADEPQVFYLLASALRETGHAEEAKAAMARVQALHSTALDAEKQAMSSKVAGAR